jgi:hypothetical protein
MAPERFASVLSTGEYEALSGLISGAARELHGRVIWNVNSTAKVLGTTAAAKVLVSEDCAGGVE